MSILQIDGNLLRDPEWRETYKGKRYIEFSIAHNYDWKNKDAFEVFRVHVYGKDADYVEKTFQKGSRVSVTGRFIIERYTKKDGGAGLGFKIMALDLVGRARLKARDEQAPAYEEPANKPTSTRQAPQDEVPPDLPEGWVDEDDGLPF